MTHALTEGGESSQVSDAEGSGEPPKKGDICIDECGQAQVFDGNGWVPWRFVVTGTGQITPTDSPIDWVLGAWKTPFQAADDVAVLGFAKFAGGKSGKVYLDGIGNIAKEGYHTIKSKILKEAGITNFAKTVGTNPDIIGKNGFIHLKATASQFNGNIYNTGIEISKYFK